MAFLRALLRRVNAKQLEISREQAACGFCNLYLEKSD